MCSFKPPAWEYNQEFNNWDFWNGRAWSPILATDINHGRIWLFIYGKANCRRKVTMMSDDFNMQATCLCQTVPCSAGVQMEHEFLMKMVLVHPRICHCLVWGIYLKINWVSPPPMILEAYIWWQPSILNTDGLMILAICQKRRRRYDLNWCLKERNRC